MPRNLSRKNKRKFDTFGSALGYLLENRGISQAWLSKKSGQRPDDINRIIQGRVKNPTDETRSKLTDPLNIDISQNYEGEWVLEEGGDLQKTDPNKVEELLSEYESRKADRGVSQTERDLLIGFLEEQAESLAKGLRLLRQLERYRRDHHPDD